VDDGFEGEAGGFLAAVVAVVGEYAAHGVDQRGQPLLAGAGVGVEQIEGNQLRRRRDDPAQPAHPDPFG